MEIVILDLSLFYTMAYLILFFIKNFGRLQIRNTIFLQNYASYFICVIFNHSQRERERKVVLTVRTCSTAYYWQHFSILFQSVHQMNMCSIEFCENVTLYFKTTIQWYKLVYCVLVSAGTSSFSHVQRTGFLFWYGLTQQQC